MATVEVRQLRERIRCRMALVGLRAGVKNRIQALLHRLGLLHDHSDLFGLAIGQPSFRSRAMIAVKSGMRSSVVIGDARIAAARRDRKI